MYAVSDSVEAVITRGCVDGPYYRRKRDAARVAIARVSRGDTDRAVIWANPPGDLVHMVQVGHARSDGDVVVAFFRGER